MIFNHKPRVELNDVTKDTCLERMKSTRSSRKTQSLCIMFKVIDLLRTERFVKK